MFTIEGMIGEMLVYNYVSLIALILAIYFYWKYRTSFPLIIPFLVITNFVEIFLVYYFAVKYRNNLDIYNYYNILVITYYSYIYFKHFDSTMIRKWIMVGYAFWVLFTIYCFQALDPLTSVLPHYIFGLIFVMLLIILFFKSIIKSIYNINLVQLPIFYFSLGIVLFFVSVFPILVFPEELLVKTSSINMNILLQLGNILLNLGYIGAVIWSRTKKS